MASASARSAVAGLCARTVERAGARLVVLEPDGRSIDLIGLNPRSRRRVEEVGIAAAIEVAAYLRQPAVWARLAGLKGLDEEDRMALSR